VEKVQLCSGDVSSASLSKNFVTRKTECFGTLVPTAMDPVSEVNTFVLCVVFLVLKLMLKLLHSQRASGGPVR
jgi:hypothetical protein